MPIPSFDSMKKLRVWLGSDNSQVKVGKDVKANSGFKLSGLPPAVQFASIYLYAWVERVKAVAKMDTLHTVLLMIVSMLCKLGNICG